MEAEGREKHVQEEEAIEGRSSGEIQSVVQRCEKNIIIERQTGLEKGQQFWWLAKAKSKDKRKSPGENGLS